MKPQNCVALEPRPLPVCVITSNLEGNQNWEHLGPAPCGRVVGDLYTSPHMCYLAEVCRSMSNGTSVIKEIHLKKMIPGILPFQVTQGHRTDTDRYAIDDFPSMSLACTVCKINGDFSRKSQKKL